MVFTCFQRGKEPFLSSYLEGEDSLVERAPDVALLRGVCVDNIPFLPALGSILTDFYDDTPK